MRNRAITRASISGSICSFSFLQPLGSGRHTSLGVSAHVQQEELTYRARPGMHRECDHATLGSSRNAGPTLEDFRACRIHRKQSFSVLNNNFNTHIHTHTHIHTGESRALRSFPVPDNHLNTLVCAPVARYRSLPLFPTRSTLTQVSLCKSRAQRSFPVPDNHLNTHTHTHTPRHTGGSRSDPFHCAYARASARQRHA
jgi:hypothetical protein